MLVLGPLTCAEKFLFPLELHVHLFPKERKKKRRKQSNQISIKLNKVKSTFADTNRRKLAFTTEHDQSRMIDRGEATRHDSSERRVQFGNLFATIVRKMFLVGNG